MTTLVEATVEVGFTAGTWTDVSDYRESDVTIGFGRGDELSQADANTCTMLLDNTDGRFTPGKASGAYYPNVKVGVPIRVTATVDGVTSRRFTGYVDSWRLMWGDTDTAAQVEVQCSSLLARLGLTAERRSVIEETIGLLGPAAYYTLGDPQGSTSAAEAAGNESPLLQRGGGTGVTFGDATGPTTDGLTAATFSTNGKYLRGSVTAPAADFTLLCFVATTDTSAAFILGFGDIALGIDISGDVLIGTPNSLYDTSSTDINDGSVHLVAIRWDDSTNTAEAVVNGVQVASVIDAAALPNSRLYVGNGHGAFSTATADTVNGSIAHVALAHEYLSDATLAEVASAGRTGFAGEALSTRFDRYLSWVGATGTTSQTTPVAHTDTTGRQVVDLVRALETTEGGVLYDERDGTLVLVGRAGRYTEPVSLSFDVAAQQVGGGYAPTTDRQGLANDVTYSTADGGTTVRVIDQDSADAYGVASDSVETLTTDTASLRPAAQWAVHVRAEPRERVSQLVADVLNANLGTADLLGLTVGSRVAVTNPPAQAAGDGDYFVEGYTETFGSTGYEIAFNVSPAAPWNTTLILDDSDRGVLDTNVLAY